MDYSKWLFITFIAMLAINALVSLFPYVRRFLPGAETQEVKKLVAPLIFSHFQPLRSENIFIAERRFPYRMRADLQRALDKIVADESKTLRFTSVRFEYYGNQISLADCMIHSEQNPITAAPTQYEELDIGEEEPLRVLKNGLWLLEQNHFRFAVLLSPHSTIQQTTGVQIQIGVPNDAKGKVIASSFFDCLEKAVSTAASYRGKILSLEQSVHSYSGESAGIKVHKLRYVERDQIILPETTLRLLERNVIDFVKNRSKLAKLGMSTKKGILIYGPPGTGKTHTIHFLTRALESHTTLLISAEQVGLLGEYMTLARLLQPSIVVVEDADLIARDRMNMDSPCEEVLLNKLLNEMDGLNEDADILFLLTTNRPETLEAALASRPGRIDQAIEFPLPDELGRRKLVSLYGGNLALDDDIKDSIAIRTQGVSASFIKELMRRISQYAIERDGAVRVNTNDIDYALDEMLVKGGKLNLSILGGG